MRKNLPGSGPRDREIILQASRWCHGGNTRDGLLLLARVFPALRFALSFVGPAPRRLFEPVFAVPPAESTESEAALALEVVRKFWLNPPAERV